MGFNIIVYAKADGTEPINEFLYSLDYKMRKKVMRRIRMLG